MPAPARPHPTSVTVRRRLLLAVDQVVVPLALGIVVELILSGAGALAGLLCSGAADAAAGADFPSDVE